MKLIKGETYLFSANGKKWKDYEFIETTKTNKFRCKAKTTTGTIVFKHFKPLQVNNRRNLKHIVDNSSMILRIASLEQKYKDLESENYSRNVQYANIMQRMKDVTERLKVHEDDYESVINNDFDEKLKNLEKRLIKLFKDTYKNSDIEIDRLINEMNNNYKIIENIIETLKNKSLWKTIKNFVSKNKKYIIMFCFGLYGMVLGLIVSLCL